MVQYMLRTSPLGSKHGTCSTFDLDSKPSSRSSFPQQSQSHKAVASSRILKTPLKPWFSWEFSWDHSTCFTYPSQTIISFGVLSCFLMISWQCHQVTIVFTEIVFFENRQGLVVYHHVFYLMRLIMAPSFRQPYESSNFRIFIDDLIIDMLMAIM